MTNAGTSPAAGNFSPGKFGKLTGAFYEGWGEHVEALQRHWSLLLGLGIGLVLIGFFAMGAALLTTLATIFAIGIVLLAAGGVQLISAFWTHGWRGFFVEFFCGIIYLVLAFLMLSHPVEAAAGLTLMFAALLLAAGATRIVLSLVERFPGRWWVLLNGIVSFALGLLIWWQWPADSLWIIGLFVGIELLFSGLAWIMLSLELRRARDAAEVSKAPHVAHAGDLSDANVPPASA